MKRRFAQVDVFTEVATRGNPLAVVVDSDGLTADEMQRFANWTNLSETTFLTAPTSAGADYGVRIFTPREELPFAGHPTLGSCRVWLDHGGSPGTPGVVVQECGAGLVSVKVDGSTQAFEAPPLIRTGDVDAELADRLTRSLRLTPDQVVACQWVDNGPRWVGVLVSDAQTVLSIDPDAEVMGELHVGVAGRHEDGGDFDLEVRAFFQSAGGVAEDPVTGSLNASLAQWLLREGRMTAPYRARQGTVLDRDGRVSIDKDEAGSVWVGGGVVTCVRGTVDI